MKLHALTHKNGYTKTDEICPLLLKAPFVCNGCEKRNHSNCPYARRIYTARIAQQEYETVLKESREGIPLNKESFYETERIISDAVRSGQHIYHAICANNLAVSKSSVYRYIQQGYYTISKIDLPRAVKFKPRSAPRPLSVPKGVRLGRTYADFLTFCAENPSVSIVEMDTVIGRAGGKVIMTFQFVNVDFMFGILMENKTAAEAGTRIQMLKEKMRDAEISFGDIFPVLLTDNGGEFSHVHAFEDDLSGQKETSVFFCDPNSPFQKPHVENNHELFRSIVPGGTSFDDFTQETVNLIFSHINGVKRKQFNGKSAFEMFSFTYSEKLSEILGVSYVAPQKVVQSPALLRK